MSLYTLYIPVTGNQKVIVEAENAKEAAELIAAESSEVEWSRIEGVTLELDEDEIIEAIKEEEGYKYSSAVTIAFSLDHDCEPDDISFPEFEKACRARLEKILEEKSLEAFDVFDTVEYQEEE